MCSSRLCHNQTAALKIALYFFFAWPRPLAITWCVESRHNCIKPLLDLTKLWILEIEILQTVA